MLLQMHLHYCGFMKYDSSNNKSIYINNWDDVKSVYIVSCCLCELFCCLLQMLKAP